MKKLIMMVAVVAAAVAANAATFTWKTSTTGKVYYSGGASTYSGTATLYDASGVTQLAVLTALLNGTATPDSLTSTAISSGAISTTATGNQFTVPTGYSSGDQFSAFFATFYTENKQTYVYISSTQSAATPATGDKTLSSFSEKDASKAAVTTFAKDATITYSGAGWYTIAAGTDPTPEPTSGLLLLLGVAGLALKRKHA